MKDKLKKVKKPVQLLKSKKKKLLEPRQKKKIESMSVEEFMSGFTDRGVKEKEKNKTKQKINKSMKSVKNISKRKLNGLQESENADVAEKEEEEESEVESDLDNEYKSHKKQLHSLKQSDPDFYKYLEENDQELLNFDDSDVDSDRENEENEKVHKPPDSLEIASDDSDYEPDEEVTRGRSGKSNKVTKEMIAEWQKKLRTKCKVQDLREVTEAFHSALVSVSQEKDSSSVYVVEGGVVFNAIIRMCVSDLLPAVQNILKNKSSKMNATKCKNWNKVKPVLKNYLMDLAEFSTATSPNMLRVLLKHIHQLSPFIVCFPIIAPKFLKRVIQLWATDEDVIRVLAFLCALRLANLRPSLLKRALKMMHLTYVRNTKFVSPNTLPGINFMRQSLCEMFALDNTISYHMVFLHVRQLAICLRSAITQRKKESHKIVYNWAYVSSLHLWAELFGMVPRDSPLRSLVYPLVQIVVGVIKLIPSPAYYPLRFHCCRILVQIRDKCEVFVPILPFLLEVLRDYNFKREHKKLTVKPLDFTCLLRCSKSQMKENGFKDAIVENVYGLMMDYLAVECHRLSFPDLMVPCLIQVKRFVKTCKFSNYGKKMKSILDKVQENCKFVEAERKKLGHLRLDDSAGIESAEVAIKAKGPPFLKYHESWRKIQFQQQARKMTNNQALGDFKLPVVKKQGKKKKSGNGPAVLFPSSDEEDSLGEGEEEIPPAKKRKKTKSVGEEIEVVDVKEEPLEFERDVEEEMDDVEEEEDEGEEDVVEDLNYSDLK